MFWKPSSGTNGRASEGGPANPDCLVIRDEIISSVSGACVEITEIVTIHLEQCDSCREWEADYRRIHGLCRESEAGTCPSRLTSSAIRACTLAPERPGAARDVTTAPERIEVRDMGALLVVSLAVLAFNLILALFLDGRARAIYPGVLFVCMLASAVAVFRDSHRRGMSAAFWAALVPFTIPAGIVAYLVCRARGSSKCPACGRTVPVADRFCPDCGHALAEFCCGCGRPVRKEYRACPFCGTHLEECFPREDPGHAACGWSRAQIIFVALVNTALFGVFLAALMRGVSVASLGIALVVALGYFPVFNWVAVDSRRRAMSTVPWGGFVLVTLYIGLVIYLACRKDERVACPVCGSYPPASFNFCPCCGSVLGAVCASCGAPAARGSHFCTSCGAQRFSPDASPPSPGSVFRI
ncbi:MAG: zinc ribbon domain-containing protein [Candidatus Krumholzibacteriaceae bacterium]